MQILERYPLFGSVLPTSTGIYAITNKINGDLYIGKASGVNKFPSQCGFRSRFSHHRRELKKGRHHSKKFQEAFDYYIKQGFNPVDVYEIWIVEYVPSDRCEEVEDEYIAKYHPFYNSLKCDDWYVIETSLSKNREFSKFIF